MTIFEIQKTIDGAREALRDKMLTHVVEGPKVKNSWLKLLGKRFEDKIEDRVFSNLVEADDLLSKASQLLEKYEDLYE